MRPGPVHPQPQGAGAWRHRLPARSALVLTLVAVSFLVSEVDTGTARGVDLLRPDLGVRGWGPLPEAWSGESPQVAWGGGVAISPGHVGILRGHQH